jgi:uncharacterized protein
VVDAARTPQQIVAEFIEARNAHDGESAARLVAGDLEWQVPRSSGAPLRGKNAINALLGGLADQLFQPFTVRRHVKRILADGDVVVVEHTVTGTTIGGKQYANDYCWVYEVRDGVIGRVTSYSDTLGSQAAFSEDGLAAALGEVRQR